MKQSLICLIMLSLFTQSVLYAQDGNAPKKKILKVKQLPTSEPTQTSSDPKSNTTPTATTTSATPPPATTPPATTPPATTPSVTKPSAKPATVIDPKNTRTSPTKNQLDAVKKEEVDLSKIKTDENLPQQHKIEAGPAALPAPKEFIEGEIVKVGQIGLLPWENRFGAMVGIERLGDKFYASITPGMNYKFRITSKRALSLTLGVPLRFEILDPKTDVRFDNAGKFRSQDWDEVSDFAKIIQRLTLGGKEQHFYLDINRFSNRTLGHGSLIKRYDSNLNFNTSRVGLQLDAFNDYVGFESVVNDITRPNIVGGLVFFKPLSLIDRKKSLYRSFSLGVSMVGDFRAPLRNDLDRYDIDKDGRRTSELTINPNNFQPKSLTSNVIGYGFDAEIKLYDKKYFDWKTYVDYSFLETGLPTKNATEIRTDYVSTQKVRSGGFTWGHLIRSNVGTGTIHAFRARLEYRNYDANYLPSYFDPLYEIQRVQYAPNGSITDLANATKAQQIFSRTGSRIHGGYLEGNWRYGDYVAIAAGIEFNSRTPDNHFFVHFELPKVGQFQFATTYQRRNATSLGQAFEFNLNNNNIWIVQSRYLLSRFIATNLSVMTPFGFSSDSSVFRNTLQVNLSVDIGFAFLDGTASNQPKPTTQTGSPASRLEN